jgi:hypothetical protein
MPAAGTVSVPRQVRSLRPTPVEGKHMETTDPITGYPLIDGLANYDLPYLPERDQAKLRNRLKNDAALYRERNLREEDGRAMLHTLGELRLGSYLARKGYSVEYEKKIKYNLDNKTKVKTPDWTIFDPRPKIVGVVDLANFHGDIRFEEALKGGPPARVPGSEEVLSDLYSNLEDKCLKYNELSNNHGIYYIVAAYLHFSAWDALSPDQVRELWCNQDTGLFDRFPEVSGFLHFAESVPSIMRYEQNEKALRPIKMPSGWLYD